MDLVKDLLEKKESLLQQLKAIDVVLELYGHKEVEYKSQINESNIVNEHNVIYDFPKNARKEKQVIWLFDNVIRKGVKLNEVQEQYNALTGFSKNKQIKITSIARRLKRQGQLVVVKYNNQNTLCFWGLPYWIQGNDYKKEYRPNENLLPGIVSSEVIMGDQVN